MASPGCVRVRHLRGRQPSFRRTCASRRTCRSRLRAWLRGVDKLAAKLPLATKLGAHEVYTIEEAVDAGLRAPVVIEAAGYADAFELAVKLTSVGGITVTVSLPHQSACAAISPAVLTGEARTLMGSYLGSAVPSSDIPTYVEMWREGRLPVEQLISAKIRLDDINAAMDALEQGRELRQVIVFDD